jgi:hypothetical protein
MSNITYEKDGAVGVVTMAKPPHNLLGTVTLLQVARAKM